MSETPDPTHAASGAPDAATDASLTFRIEAALTAMGLTYTTVADNAFLTNVAEQPVIVRTTDTVPNVLRVISEWRTPDDLTTDRLTRLEACNDVNGGLPTVKCGLNGDDVIFATEAIISEETDVRAMIIFAIQAIGAGTRVWLDRVHAQAGQNTASNT